jgi:glycosyltransferase involved in cell wall biosynthesis
LASLLERTDQPFGLVLDTYGASDEVRAAIEAAAWAYPGIAATDDPASTLAGRRAVWLAGGSVVGRNWLDLILADTDRRGAGVAHELPSQGRDLDAFAALTALGPATPPGKRRSTEGAACVLDSGGSRPSARVTRAVVARAPAPLISADLARVEADRLTAALGGPLRIGYLLLGLPPEGGGGPHSIYQEASGLRDLGLPAQILLPSDALGQARETYGTDDRFSGYGDEAELRSLVDGLDVAVATEFETVATLDAIRGRRTMLACYAQDYEVLFPQPRSERADRALLALGSAPDLLIFAKTAWLCELVAGAHGLPVARIPPSLDRDLYRPRSAPRRPGPLRIVAMLRPRTPRRRPAATLRVLSELSRMLGPELNVRTFGCRAEELGESLPDGDAPGGHLGVLARPAVADLLRDADVFVDLSAYQAFGRTGLEAMACGCVPVLPRRGGASEYAIDGVNARIIDTLDDAEAIAAVRELTTNPEEVRSLRAAGLETAGRYSIHRTALSTYALFAQRLAIDRIAEAVP